ncbi:GNAT family N-acetyltransferase [Nostoc sp. FACHB-145]|uniref:GNAT family N-acetyltransferase n=1 Tax=Nostoc sp. FACHB-145 TaxID=2692836 RepID=UPI0016876151|nr:GNAT family N-acetyltransferase [Nostoc sp. FACHB-145]MBD2472966.1 GNAT family N-acetyltransferase [Nostoc sp. FACHB-145]
MIDFSILSLCASLPGDEPFLFELYASTRAEELDAWGWDESQRNLFLQMQFKAQQWTYRTNFPDAQQQLVKLGDRSIGSILVHRSAAEICLVSIALLPEYRNQGIGTYLIQQLLQKATQTQRSVKLQLLSGSRVFRLYQRLGFTKIGDSVIHWQMEWRLPEVRRSSSPAYSLGVESISSI